MTRILLAALALVGALVLTVGALAAAAPKANGTVGPGFTINLAKAGKKVTTLKAGKYSFVISDKSNIHNFHLRGPGVNKMTTVPQVKTSTWAVTLKKGTYTYVCDPHASSMKGSFRVT